MVVPTVSVVDCECVSGARGLGPVGAVGENERAVVGFEILYLLSEVVNPFVEEL